MPESQSKSSFRARRNSSCPRRPLLTSLISNPTSDVGSLNVPDLHRPGEPQHGSVSEDFLMHLQRSSYLSISTISPAPVEQTSLQRAPTAVHGAEDQNEDHNDGTDHVIMSLDVRERAMVGCACYISREGKLMCMEDLPRGGQATLDQLKVDLQPTLVLLSTRAEGLFSTSLDDRIARGSSLVDTDTKIRPLPYEVQLRPGPEFSFESALSKLAYFEPALSDMSTKLIIPGDSTTHGQYFEGGEFGFSDRDGRLLQVSSQLDLDSKTSIGCIGALISYLQRKRASEYLREDQEARFAYRILRIEMFSFRDTMFVNADTLSTLQIILPESHPNIFNRGPGASGSKEGLSVFGLFQHHARTPQGKARLRTIFLRPSLDVNVIKERLDFVSTLMRPSNIEVAQRLSQSLTKIKNMRNIMALLHKGVVSGSNKQGSFKSGVWSPLLEFCYHAIDVAGAIQDILGSEHLPLCARVSKALTKFELQRIGSMVHEVVDVESSVEQHRTVIKRGISQHLDQIKDHYGGISNLLTRIADEIVQTMPSDINCSLNVIFFPQLGFHITVPRKKNTNKALWSDTDWEQTFSTADQVYFKNAQMRQMDHDLGDLWGNICDIEIELTYDLAQSVLEKEEMLIEASDTCGELDSLLVFVHGAIEHKLTRPRLVEENIIDIKAGRHLLQEMTVSSYVPNDARVAGGDATMIDESQMPNMLVLTGPSYSGKSVYQKQVALIAYMAQMGSFVAAEACTIGITDKILTSIATTETISKARSAFTIDLQQIALTLNLCTSRSLVLIDEFGRGTDSCDGAGLAAGVFYHLLNRGSETPKVLVASHYHEVFETGFFDDHPKLRHGHMAVYIDDARTPAQDRSALHVDMTEVTYLYTLQGGRSNLSYGAQCAAMNGVPEQIVHRALMLADLMTKGEDLVTVCAALPEQDIQQLQEAETSARAFMALNLETRLEDDGVDGLLSSVLDETLVCASRCNTEYCGQTCSTRNGGT